MKCHYEVLELAKTADDAEIKKSYRKLALKWHPDKNLDCQEQAREQFQFVQQAYEVLSDPQERAWYDNHREQILRGGHTNYEDNSIDLFQFFTASCYKGFSDSPEGFYAVYSEVFNTIASEEIEFMENEEDFGKIPKFGNSHTDYEVDVRLFYAYWESYCTKKSYAWLNPHNISEIRDRRIFKIIEKENKKIQQKARKERNEEIRSLVAFVRKRDKRVIAYKKILEERAQQNRLKSEQNRLDQIRRKNQEIEEQVKSSSNIFDHAYEEQLRRMEEALTDSDDEEFDLEDEEISEQIEDLDLEGDEIYNDDLYCIACDKLFKNESSYKNHESSKKHKQNVDVLKKEMKAENDVVLVDNEKTKKPEEESKKSKKKTQNVNVEELAEEDIEGDEEVLDDEVLLDEKDEEEDLNTIKPKQKGKKSKKKAQSVKVNMTEEHEKVHHDVLNEILKEKESENVDWTDSKKSKKGKSKAKEKQSKKSEDLNETVTEATPVSLAPIPILEEEIVVEKVDIDHICVTCKANFPSKNKLFNHLKNMGHGVYIPKNEKVAEKVKGGGKKKK